MFFSGMKIYTVHVKPEFSNAQEKPLFVREGFSVFAFLFTFLWALYHRLWLPGAALLIANLALMGAQEAGFLSQGGTAIILLAVQGVAGFHANDWLRGRLAREGYIMADISAADSLHRAEQRYFERYLSTRHPAAREA